MKQTTVDDCRIIDLRKISDPRGNLTVIEGQGDIPFDIKRVYYLYDVPGGESRGAHAHKQLQQLIVAASGSFTVTLDDGTRNVPSTLSVRTMVCSWYQVFGVIWMTSPVVVCCFAWLVSTMMRRIIYVVMRNF